MHSPAGLERTRSQDADSVLTNTLTLARDSAFPGILLPQQHVPGWGGRALGWAGGGDPHALQCLNVLGVQVSGGGGGGRVAETKAEWRRRSLIKLVN